MNKKVASGNLLPSSGNHHFEGKIIALYRAMASIAL